MPKAVNVERLQKRVWDRVDAWAKGSVAQGIPDDDSVVHFVNLGLDQASADSIDDPEFDLSCWDLECC
eukprot:m.132012 g.132012  ORF g.132012 m.132012 type:complete len:68 (-) comp52373_c0_seq4:1184-1387(-)